MQAFLRPSKNLVEFRRRSGERNKICFLPRHVRGGKHFSSRKRAKWPQTVDILCAVAGRNLFVGKGFAFFDELKRLPCRRSFDIRQPFE